MRVGEIVSGDVWSVTPSAGLHEVSARMLAHDIAALLVLDGERLIGIVTERDLIVAIDDRNITSAEVWEYMIPEPITVSPDSPVDEAARLMIDEHVRHLPVVSPKGDLWGILSIRELLEAVTDSEPEQQVSDVGDAMDLDPDDVDPDDVET